MQGILSRIFRRLQKGAPLFALSNLTLALIVGIAYRLHLNTAIVVLLSLSVIVVHALADGFISSAIVSIIAGACLVYFFAYPIFDFRIDDPVDLVAFLIFLLISNALAGLVSKGYGALRDSRRQRKQAEAELRESEQRLKNAERLARIGHWQLDLRTNHVSGSEEMYRIFVKPPEYIPTYEGFLEDLTPSDRERVQRLMNDSLERKVGHSIEYQIALPNGDLKSISCIWELQLDEEGTPVSMFGTCQDITDSRRAQGLAMARQKLESLGVLASGIAHDFNNLLGGIHSMAELLETYLAEGSEPMEEVQKIKIAAIRGSEIVRELMIYAGENQQDLNETVNVSSLVQEMLQLLTVSISKQVALKTDFRGDLPAVWGSAPQIRQVVMNLVLNASEAIGDTQGVITVTAAQVTGDKNLALNNAKDLIAGDYVRIEVSDTGCGMTEETRAKIFDPFFSTKFAGRGLGLAVVQGIVRDLGGAIDIVSAPGKGAAFQVLLPCAPKGASEIHSADTSAGPDKSNANAQTILVVEDDQILRLAVSKGLQKRGFSVIEASDGFAALDLIHAHKDEIDVVLLDVTVPGASSREVFEEVLRIRPDLKVVVTSAYDKQMVDAHYSGLRVNHFIRKPFQLDDLVRLCGSTFSAKAR